MENIPKKASLKRSTSTDDVEKNGGSGGIQTTSASAMVVFEFREAKTWNGSGSVKVDPECMMGLSSSEDGQRDMKKKRGAIRRQQKMMNHDHDDHRGRLVLKSMNMNTNTNMKTKDDKPAAPAPELMMTAVNFHQDHSPCFSLTSSMEARHRQASHRGLCTSDEPGVCVPEMMKSGGRPEISGIHAEPITLEFSQQQLQVSSAGGVVMW